MRPISSFGKRQNSPFRAYIFKHFLEETNQIGHRLEIKRLGFLIFPGPLSCNHSIRIYHLSQIIGPFFYQAVSRMQLCRDTLPLFQAVCTSSTCISISAITQSAKTIPRNSHSELPIIHFLFPCYKYVVYADNSFRCLYHSVGSVICSWNHFDRNFEDAFG